MKESNTDLHIETYSADMIVEFPVYLCNKVSDGVIDMHTYKQIKKRTVARAKELGMEITVENLFEVFEKARTSKSTAEKAYPDYIRINQNGRVTVDCAVMAETIRDEEHIFIEANESQKTTNIYMYENGVYRLVSEDMLATLVAGILRDIRPDIIRMKDVKEVVNNLIACCKKVDTSEINANENYINFENGILDISKMKLTEHSPSIYSTIRIPCNWNPDEKNLPVFRSFLETVTNGEKRLQQLLAEFIGACVSNVNGSRFKKGLFIIGEGNTGKTQYVKLLEMILGQKNCANGIPLDVLESDRFATSQLYGKRLSGDADLSFLTVKELNTFKKITGGDMIYAQKKGKPQFSFVYKGLLMYSMNKLPNFGGDRGDWVYDRILIAPFCQVIPPEKRDPHIADKMYAEREAIINFCMQCFIRAVKRGYKFTEPQVSTVLKNQYKIQNSPVKRFFVECCDLRPKDKTPDDKFTAAFMYTYFKSWCRDNNNGYIVRKCEFKDELCDLLKKSADELTIKTYKTNYYCFTLNGDMTREYYGKNFLNV